MKKYKIGIFGSAEGDIEHIFKKAQKLGEVLANKGVIIVTGAANGLPYQVALSASKQKAEIWEFSPHVNLKSQIAEIPNADFTIFKKIIFVPKTYEFAKSDSVRKKYRNISSTATSDAGIIISGRWGTLNEFTNLFDMGKVIGVLTETGGVADELEDLSKKINKPSKAKIIFNTSPKKLVELVLKELENR